MVVFHCLRHATIGFQRVSIVMPLLLNLSVYVIAYNDEPNMRACLESVAGWGDELIVVDSHSTDQTAAIAREFTE